MHGSVREGLENLLAAKSMATASEADLHVAGCTDCAAELNKMREQARLFRALRPPAEIEPAAGFYARVLQRIEERAKHSIWWVFVYSPVGKRLAYSSLVIAVALGSYVVAAENSDGHLRSVEITVEPTHYDELVTGDTNEQRQAVLANFVAHPSVAE